MRLIDADEFLRNEIERCGCVPLVGTCTNDNESLRYRFECAPTIDPESLREHGRWIAISHDPDDTCCKCSECGKLKAVRTNYCPKCGCKMDLEDEKDV